MDQKRDSLSLPQVGGRGQIRDWKDYEDQPGHDGHRHLSEHLGLYPLNMYTPTRFPELYAAAGVSNNLAIKDSIIHLLPALPDVWPSGSVSGLCTRGGFEVSMMWTNKQLVPGTVVIKSKKGAISRVKNDFYLRNDFHILNSAGKPTLDSYAHQRVKAITDHP